MRPSVRAPYLSRIEARKRTTNVRNKTLKGNDNSGMGTAVKEKSKKKREARISFPFFFSFLRDGREVGMRLTSLRERDKEMWEKKRSMIHD